MDLRGYEFFKTNGLPVSGALVEVWDAVDGTPGGSPLFNTTTTANGKWEFTGLTNTPKDVKVTFTGSIRWYKGLTEAGLTALFVGAGGATLVDPKVTGQVTIGPGSYSLPSVTGNTDRWRYTKAYGGTLTVSPASGEALVAPGGTAASAINVAYTSPAGESVGWYCNGSQWFGI